MKTVVDKYNISWNNSIMATIRDRPLLDIAIAMHNT